MLLQYASSKFNTTITQLDNFMWNETVYVLKTIVPQSQSKNIKEILIRTPNTRPSSNIFRSRAGTGKGPLISPKECSSHPSRRVLSDDGEDCLSDVRPSVVYNHFPALKAMY
jgi:hypothetical protein